MSVIGKESLSGLYIQPFKSPVVQSSSQPHDYTPNALNQHPSNGTDHSLKINAHHPWRQLNLKRLRLIYRALQDDLDLSLAEQADIYLGKIQSLSEQSSADAFRDMLSDQESDPSKQYVIACEVLDRLQNEPVSEANKKSIQQLRQLLQNFTESHGVEVKAGLNTADAIASTLQHAPPTLTKQLIRNLYRDQLLLEILPGAFVEKLLEKYTAEEIEAVVKSMLAAASEDMNSAHCSSTEKVALCLVNLRNGKLILQVLQTFKTGIKKIVQSIEKNNHSFVENQVACVFKKTWQNLALDIIRLSAIVPSRDLVKAILIEKHLHEDYCIEPFGGVAKKYLLLLKKVFGELPDYLFNDKNNPNELPEDFDREKKAIINRYFWVDFIQDAYKGREFNAEWIKC